VSIRPILTLTRGWNPCAGADGTPQTRSCLSMPFCGTNLRNHPWSTHLPQFHDHRWNTKIETSRRPRDDTRMSLRAAWQRSNPPAQEDTWLDRRHLASEPGDGQGPATCKARGIEGLAM